MAAQHPNASLLGIPLELRLQIYSYVLAQTKGIPAFSIYDNIGIGHNHRQSVRRYKLLFGPSPYSVPSILLVCRSIYEEAVAAWYDSQTVELRIFSGRGWSCDALDPRLGEIENFSTLQQLRHVCIKIHVHGQLANTDVLERVRRLGAALNLNKVLKTLAVEIRLSSMYLGPRPGRLDLVESAVDGLNFENKVVTMELVSDHYRIGGGWSTIGGAPLLERVRSRREMESGERCLSL